MAQEANLDVAEYIIKRSAQNYGIHAESPPTPGTKYERHEPLQIAQKGKSPLDASEVF